MTMDNVPVGVTDQSAACSPSVRNSVRLLRRFSQNVLNSPMFERKDVAGLIGAAVMTLGPLAAYSFGFGA
ncbi:hypothetical protein [Mesorhizobium loti]|uniref:hypothetical protein n=1 Tax=Rhizobium loti TaxID=381 RepID=UPI00047D86CF|nr:hypothetical protein [Mesorhizobium loti]